MIEDDLEEEEDEEEERAKKKGCELQLQKSPVKTFEIELL